MDIAIVRMGEEEVGVGGEEGEEMKLSTPILSSSLAAGPFIGMEALRLKRFGSSVTEDAPSVAESDVSSFGGFDITDDISVAAPTTAVPPRTPLQWEFHGLTLWLEFEEYDSDLTKAVDHAVRVYGTERIPVPHATAIYGMLHLSEEEAVEKLNKIIPEVVPEGCWPSLMEAPRGVTCDIAQEGRPGQVCSVAWAELTLRSNERHEAALDSLYDLFEIPTSARRTGPWTPHISIAYDNPEDNVLNLRDTVDYIIAHPSLFRSRRVKAISLWNTSGKMRDWQCLDRVNFM